MASETSPFFAVYSAVQNSAPVWAAAGVCARAVRTGDEGRGEAGSRRLDHVTPHQLGPHKRVFWHVFLPYEPAETSAASSLRLAVLPYD